LIKEARNKFKNHHVDLLNATYFHDACKEFAEASITSDIIFKNTIPVPDDLLISYAAYLNGLAESVGELRRYLLDSLRASEFSQSEKLLNIMDDIYAILVTMDFPDAITYGLRRNTDIVRGIVEKTRGELTLIIQNNLLQQKISSLSQTPDLFNK
jgi:translin